MLAKTAQNQPSSPPMYLAGSDTERRCHPRLRLALPVVLFRAGHQGRLETTTVDVSCDSFYFVSDQHFSLDERLECELLIPGDEVSSVPTEDLCLRCEIKIVRVVPRGRQAGFGVACRLEDYTVSRSPRDFTQN